MQLKFNKVNLNLTELRITKNKVTLFLISSGQFYQNKPMFSKVNVSVTIYLNNLCLSNHVLNYIMSILPK